MHDVVNSLQALEAHVRFGVIPLGTGNDLARTLMLPPDPRDAFALLDSGPTAKLDLFTAEAGGKMCYGINVAAGGFSGKVDEVITDELKATWGPLAYLISAASIVADMPHHLTTFTYENGETEQFDALNVIVANGRTAAGGHAVAPLANPEDGLLDLAIVRPGTAIELAEVAARLLAGRYIDSRVVEHRQVAQVRVAAEPGMLFNVDGELFTDAPVTFKVVPAALEVTTGSDYRAEPKLKND